jgi:Holliday junction resolvasome RuvABC ATP-dependent DNA helicase subunit
VLKLDFYDENDLSLIIDKNSKKLKLELTEHTLEVVAKKSR